MQQKSINLCMIVKDEAHIIERCLNSVKLLIDKVLIVDTGSSDNTIQVINDWIKKNEVEGKVVKEPWKNFAHNRSSALEHARQIDCDYSLMIDADEILNFNKDFNAVNFKCSLHKDYYLIPTKTANAFYYRPTLTSNRKDFKYKAPVHEYVESPPGASYGEVSHETDFWNVPIQDSSRNKDPRKFQKDAKLLEEALATEEDKFLRARYTFYLANSYRDAENPHFALERYLERIEMGFWEEERYMSCFKAAQLKEQLNHSEDSIISTFLKAQEHNPNRAEALHGVVKYCRTHDRNHLAYILGKEGISKTFNGSFLFAEPWVYDYAMVDEFAIAAYWAGHYRESYDSCQELLKNPKFPKDQLPRLSKNIGFAKDKLNLK
jgi:glycosyltransferase involved in cell wall biosynthesis